jgi:hypothetical protein
VVVPRHRHVGVGAGGGCTGWDSSTSPGERLHLTAGVTAAVGAALVGPRTGNIHRDGSASMIPGTTSAAGAARCLVSRLAAVRRRLRDPSENVPRGSRYSTRLLAAPAAVWPRCCRANSLRQARRDARLLGLLGGLVAISAGAGRVGPPAACSSARWPGVSCRWRASSHADRPHRRPDRRNQRSRHRRRVGHIGRRAAGRIFWRRACTSAFKSPVLPPSPPVAFGGRRRERILRVEKRTMGLRARDG